MNILALNLQGVLQILRLCLQLLPLIINVIKELNDEVQE